MSPSRDDAHRPAVTVVIQYFRHPHTLAALLLRLLSDPRVEVIAHADSHTKADAAAFWAAEALHPPPALRILYSQNVHELRAYNKAAQHARAPLLLFTQDDHLPPASPTAWLDFVIRSFDLLGPGGLDALGLTSARVCAGGLPYVGLQKCAPPMPHTVHALPLQSALTARLAICICTHCQPSTLRTLYAGALSTGSAAATLIGRCALARWHSSTSS